MLGEVISACTGLPLESGVRYATAAGNALIQMYAAGELSSEAEMRELSRKSFGFRDLTVKQDDFWDELYADQMQLWKKDGLE